MHKCSNAQMLKCHKIPNAQIPNGQMVKWPNGQMAKWPNTQMLKWPNGQMLKCTNKMLKCSNATIFQMLKCSHGIEICDAIRSDIYLPFLMVALGRFVVAQVTTALQIQIQIQMQMQTQMQMHHHKTSKLRLVQEALFHDVGLFWQRRWNGFASVLKRTPIQMPIPKPMPMPMPMPTPMAMATMG